MARWVGTLSAAACVIAAVLIGFLVGDKVVHLKAYMPLAQAITAVTAASVMIKLRPRTSDRRWLPILALWLSAGVASQLLAPDWDPPGLSPVIALAMATVAGLSVAARFRGVLAVHGITSSLVLLAGVLWGDKALLEGPGLALIAAAVGLAPGRLEGVWGSMALASAIAYSHAHLQTGWLALAGLGPSIVAAVWPIIAWEGFRLKAWSAALMLAALAGSLSPAASLFGEAAAAAMASGLLLYLLEAYGSRVAVAASAGVAAISAILATAAGLEGRGWLVLAGAGLVVGLALSRFYVKLVRVRVGPRSVQGAFLAFIAFSMLFLGLSLATRGGCSVEFSVETIETGGSTVEASLPSSIVIEGAGLAQLKLAAGEPVDFHVIDVALRRVALATVSSPGLVGSVEIYSVDANETMTVRPGEGYLLFDLEKPVSLWFAVEDAGGSYILRVAMKASGLIIPWSMLGGADYSPGHTFLRVNFTMPFVAESPAGFRLEVYSVVVYPETQPSGSGVVEDTPMGVKIEKAILGVALGSIVFSDGARIVVPANVGEDLYRAWNALMSMYQKTPGKALLVSAIPSLAYADLPSSIELTIPREATVAGAGVECTAILAENKAIIVLEECRVQPEFKGLTACIPSSQPTVSLPIYWNVDLLRAALIHNATTSWQEGSAGLAAVVLGDDDQGATAWAALYLDVLESEEARLHGSLHPYYALGALAPFIASAGFAIYSLHGRDEESEERVTGETVEEGI